MSGLSILTQRVVLFTSRAAVTTTTRAFATQPPRKFSKYHEWVEVADQIGTVGVSQNAQDSLGDIVFVETPEVGSELAAGDSAGVVESVKAVSDIYSPVSGTVTEVNETLNDSPDLVNKACYTEGWLFRLKLSDLGELESLMTEEEYLAWLETQD